MKPNSTTNFYRTLHSEAESIRARWADVLDCEMTTAETIGAIYKIGGSFEINGDDLLVQNVSSANLPDSVKNALRFHKKSIHRLVTAFGGRWPTREVSIK